MQLSLIGVRQKLNQFALIHRIKELLPVKIDKLLVAIADDFLRTLQGLMDDAGNNGRRTELAYQ
jgi:hypothetical protein